MGKTIVQLGNLCFNFYIFIFTWFKDNEVSCNSSIPSGMALILFEDKSKELRWFRPANETGNFDSLFPLASSSFRFFNFSSDLGNAPERQFLLTIRFSNFDNWPISSGKLFSWLPLKFNVFSDLKLAIHFGIVVILLLDKSRLRRFPLTFCNASGNSSSFWKLKQKTCQKTAKGFFWRAKWGVVILLLNRIILT